MAQTTEVIPTARLTTDRRARGRVRGHSPRGRLTVRGQIALQVLCLLITFTVVFPILWIFSLALDPRNLSRPDSLIPPGASLDAFARVIAQPTSDNISLLELARNSFMLASCVALLSVGIGVLAAYAFSRLRFRGREVLMITILGVLMLPAVATIAPLFILLNGIKGDLPIFGHVAIRTSLIGVGVGGHVGNPAVRDLEPQGLSRYHPQGARGGGRGRRLQPQSDPSSRSSCRWPHRPSP